MPVTESPSVHSLIHAVEQADSPERLIHAVQSLASTRSELGIPTLIRALGFNNPGAAAAAVQGLVQMGSKAVQPLLESLDDYNYGARAWSIRALVTIADPQALDVLLSAAATDFAPSVRRAAAKGLGSLQWSLLSPDHQSTAQHAAMETLAGVAQDADWSLRYAAVAGLQALGSAAQTADLGTQIFTLLQQMAETESDLAVQARIRNAITQLARSTSNDRQTIGN
jgi:phycocyanobilin lyase subunit beta